MKICFGDGDKQPKHLIAESMFTSDAARKDGLSVYCKLCAASRQRAWKHANPEKVRADKRAYRARQREVNDR